MCTWLVTDAAKAWAAKNACDLIFTVPRPAALAFAVAFLTASDIFPTRKMKDNSTKLRISYLNEKEVYLLPVFDWGLANGSFFVFSGSGNNSSG